jgi:hypothetical protein
VAARCRSALYRAEEARARAFPPAVARQELIQAFSLVGPVKPVPRFTIAAVAPFPLPARQPLSAARRAGRTHYYSAAGGAPRNSGAVFLTHSLSLSASRVVIGAQSGPSPRPGIGK